MIRGGWALWLLGIALMAWPAEARPSRIVSINLCTDQLLLAFADADQIAALSHISRDPSLSPVVAEARAFRVTTGAAEEVLALAPDLVLAGRFSRRTTRELLASEGYRVLAFDPPVTLADVRRQYVEIARAVGHPERGRALARALAERIAASAERADGARPTAVYYQKRGYAPGAGTLMDALIRAAGFRNIITDMGIEGTRRIALEEIVLAKPDFLILDTMRITHTDIAGEILTHPALRDRIAADRRIPIPQSLLVCGGPSLFAVLDRLEAAALAY